MAITLGICLPSPRRRAKNAQHFADKKRLSKHFKWGMLPSIGMVKITAQMTTLIVGSVVVSPFASIGMLARDWELVRDDSIATPDTVWYEWMT
jgi:hypothetical protein